VSAYANGPRVTDGEELDGPGFDTADEAIRSLIGYPL
jgi:hypothetical protein